MWSRGCDKARIIPFISHLDHRQVKALSNIRMSMWQCETVDCQPSGSSLEKRASGKQKEIQVEESATKNLLELTLYLRLMTAPRTDATLNEVSVSPSGSNSVVECQLPKLDVAGSIPVSRSIKLLSCVNSFCLLYSRINASHPPIAKTLASPWPLAQDAPHRSSAHWQALLIPGKLLLPGAAFV